MSGDVGAVGRLVVSDTPFWNHIQNNNSSFQPSRTFCIVNFGQAEAKIEADDFIQLTPQSNNVYKAETMFEGTLEGYTFESDEVLRKQRTLLKPMLKELKLKNKPMES